jgi:hypothetical protein
MGLMVNGSKSYAQVPGLKLHFDGRYNKSIFNIGVIPTINKWQSLTGDFVSGLNVVSLDIPNDSVNFLHHVGDGSGGKTFALLNGQPYSQWNFLHMNRFGVFGIMNYQYTSGSGNVGLVNSGSDVNGFGANLRIDINRKLVFRIADGDGTIGLTNTTTNSIPSATTFSYGLVRRSIATANNLNWYIDDVNVQNNSITIAPVGDVSKPLEVSSVISSFVGNIYYGKLLVYDWSGYSEAQINAFSVSVRVLLEAEKPLFTI